MICKRDEHPIDVEHATDDEFQAWVEWNGLPVQDNGIAEWSFDDRCMIINHVLAQGGILSFLDGKTIPEQESINSDESNSPEMASEAE